MSNRVGGRSRRLVRDGRNSSRRGKARPDGGAVGEDASRRVQVHDLASLSQAPCERRADVGKKELSTRYDAVRIGIADRVLGQLSTKRTDGASSMLGGRTDQWWRCNGQYQRRRARYL